MSRPQIIVTVSAAIPRRGAASLTGTAFLLYAGAAGSLTPVTCLRTSDATGSAATAPVVQAVGDCLEQGAPKVILLRADAVDADAVTQTEWESALGLLTDEYGPGQVLIPGVFTPAAYAALVAHADSANRTALLDADPAAAGSALVSSASGLASSNGSQRSTIVTAAILPGTAGTSRTVPGSVIAAGLAARGDAFVGHANNAPIFDQSRGAGTVKRATGVPQLFTNDELDDLNDAGVCVIRPVTGVVQLAGWVSLSDDERFRQLNSGRMSMQLGVGVAAGIQQFLGRQIDARRHLFAELEGALRGYLQPLWAADALFGSSADEAFAVEVDSVNTAETIQAGELRAAVEVSLTQHTETVLIEVVTNISEGVAA